jgi:hypothetical protein
MNAEEFTYLSQFPQIMQMPDFGAYLCTISVHFGDISLFLPIPA